MKDFGAFKASLNLKLRNCGLFILNPKERTFLNRKWKSWALIIIYYIVFYTCLFGSLCGLISLVMYGFINDKVPTLTGQQSLLRLNPGIGFLPPVDANGPLIRTPLFDTEDETNYLEFMTKYLQNYERSQTDCDFRTGRRINPDINVACKFPLDLLGVCSDPRQVLNADQNLCVYLKMNKVTHSTIPTKPI
ncbi:unnamed protein product [Mesocestoides corti]|uniref:Sodium/potassium-transporting ATPase subunit beta n=1 Tax=Mesocestoides corti TaxID=53468 RepID=A0A0R3UH60_MESCO|nr:unnamed protein product [Mesocestoides corti]